MAMELTSENFEAEVVASPVPVLVDFWAPWCAPCRMLAPIIDDLAAEYEGKIKMGKVNVENERELAVRYGVSSIPALKLFKNGAVAAETVGALPKDRIKAMLDK